MSEFAKPIDRHLNEAQRLFAEVEQHGLSDRETVLKVAQTHALLAVVHALREINGRLGAIYDVMLR